VQKKTIVITTTTTLKFEIFLNGENSCESWFLSR